MTNPFINEVDSNQYINTQRGRPAQTSPLVSPPPGVCWVQWNQGAWADNEHKGPVEQINDGRYLCEGCRED